MTKRAKQYPENSGASTFFIRSFQRLQRSHSGRKVSICRSMSWSRTFLSGRERVRTAYQRGIWLDSTVPSSMGLEGWFRDVSRIPQSTIAFPLPRSRITDWRAPGGRGGGAGPIAQPPAPLGGGEGRGGGGPP